MASVCFLKRADLDIEEAVAWYETRSVRAARRFEAEVAAQVARIARLPELYALIDQRHRVGPIKKSQYLIVYRYESQTDTVVIVTVPHAKQNPKSWP